MQDFGILGGGVTGLFTARFLGGGAHVLEGSDRVGGLARCFGAQGFRSDIGGHILFSKDKEALQHELHALGSNLRSGTRANRILYRGLHVKYPFENGIDVLPKEDIADILHTFIENPHTREPNDLREWMYHVFGSGLTERYLLPYNEKIWKTPPEEMSLEWVERVPRPPLLDLIKTAVGIPTEGYTHQLHFHYPERGGFESLPRAVAQSLGDRVSTAFRVKSVRRCDGGWAVTSATGDERRYRELISTIPVTTLLDALENVPSEVHAAARALRYNSLRVVLIGIGTENLPAYTALYVPDPESLYHRVCFNHVFSPEMVPPGHTSVSCEITVTPGSSMDQCSDEALVERTTTDLVRDRILRREDVVFRAVHRERLAYVVYVKGYADSVRVVRNYVDSLGIHLAGRFAEFKYINSDACVRRALDLSRQLRSGDIAEEARLPAASANG